MSQRTGTVAFHRQLVQELHPRPIAQTCQKIPDHPLRRLAFDPPCLTLSQRIAIRAHEPAAQVGRLGARPLETLGSNERAGDQARHVPHTGREHRFVEVVQIEILQSVVAREGAKVFQMQVAAEPGKRRVVER